MPVSSVSVLRRNSLLYILTLRHACIFCICFVEEFSPTHAAVEACSVSSVSVLWRNSFQLMRTLRHACILCICAMEKFSPTHVDVQRHALYPLYLFYGGILSNSCGHRGMLCILCICSVEEFSPIHTDVGACLYPPAHAEVDECLYPPAHAEVDECILCICSVGNSLQPMQMYKDMSESSVSVLWGLFPNSCGR
jgi:hypothetical protein